MTKVYAQLFSAAMATLFVSAASSALAQEKPKSAPPAIKRVPPVYRPELVADQVEGWVHLRVSITSEGRVDGAEVISAYPEKVFDKSALDAVKQWAFEPRRVEGKAVAFPDAELVITFKMEK